MAFVCGAPVVTNRFSASKDVCGWSRGHAVAHRESRPTAFGVVMIQLPWFNKKDAPKTNLNFACGYAYLAHPEKNTGEDAFFIEANSIGVFDGVSGAFETRGVDPRIYSQKLAALTRQNVRSYGPALVVKAAIEASKANDEIGASTACVIGMDEAGRIFGVNLGDSGARIIRDGKMIFRTKEQQHFFNCPYQLGTDSEDGLTMGQKVQQKVRDGDWLIVASDGLYDNVPEREIVQRTAAATDPMQLAEELGEVASVNGVNKSFRSPFMEAAKKAGVSWQGGKADDITIITARILDNASIEPLTLLSTIPEAAQA